MKRQTRRQFHQMLTAGAAALLAGWDSRSAMAADAPRKRPNLRYALSTGSWGRVTPPGEPLPLLKILDETAAGGFNGVRLTGYPQILEQNGLTDESYGDALAERGLEFSTVSFGGPYAEASRQAETLERARRVLALHQRYGATAAVFFPPGVVPETEERETLARCCKFFNTMGKMALEEYGVRMGLHNHTDSLVENQRQVDQYLSDTDPRYVFCAWDSAHLLLGGADVLKTYRDSIDRLVYTDFKDATLNPPTEDYHSPNGQIFAGDSHSGQFFNSITDLGRGQIDFVPLIELLKENHYRGWINHDLDTIRVSCAESWRIAREFIESKLDPIYQ